MNSNGISMEKIALVLLVLIISMIVGWYGERGVEKFMNNNNNAGQTQNY